MPPSSEDFTPHRRRRRKSAMRMGPGVLVCPRCGIPLRGSDHDLGIAWRCQACGGQSLNFSQFRRVVPEHGANDIWLQAATRPNAPKHRTECPECQGGMDAVLIPFRGTQVELDICRACQRLWLDRQEHESAAALALVPAGEGEGEKGAALKSPRMKAEMMMRALELKDDQRQERVEKKRKFGAEVFAALGWGLAYLFTWNDQNSDRRLLMCCAVALLCWLGYLVWRHLHARDDE